MDDDAADTTDPAAGHRRRFAEEARSERPDLALLCLLLGAVAADATADDTATADAGADAAVGAAVDAAQIELDRLAGLLPYGLRTPHAWATALERLLGGELGFHGTPADYRLLESSLLQEVLRRRRGLPILLSVVWVEVARRAGAPVYGVALPGHFVVGFGEPEEQVLADPFAGGGVLSPDAASARVAGGGGGGGAAPRGGTPPPPPPPPPAP
ncbi:transglutaminase-like domain-containing protein, partial [Streptomyces sp. NPDC058953]|uniref:transglutaminase-like domain-containing protein n=1 Tax=Streptomyces sp. NPDC058953 TaxID=3346676 RepID=UPI003687B6B4